MAREINLNQWLDLYEELKDKNDKHTACELGFWDWFCAESALMGKIRKMAPMVKRVITSGKVNPERCYVFFKNNCPMSGAKYDSFSICALENGNVIFYVEPKRGVVYDGRTDSFIIENDTKAMRDFFTPTKESKVDFSEKFLNNVRSLENDENIRERMIALIQNQEEDDFELRDIVFLNAEKMETHIRANFAVIYETEINGEIGLEISFPVTPKGLLAA